jgi:hypothetical protein
MESIPAPLQKLHHLKFPLPQPHKRYALLALSFPNMRGESFDRSLAKFPAWLKTRRGSHHCAEFGR